MKNLMRPILVLLFIFILPNLVLGQASSDSKKEDDGIIVCRFGYTQSVKFNVIGRGKKEFLDLRHTDILIYENDKLQELYYFRVLEDDDLKKNGYRYEIGYDPLFQIEDGKYRAIRIIAKVKGQRRLKIIASLKGYYATKGYYKY